MNKLKKINTYVIIIVHRMYRELCITILYKTRTLTNEVYLLQIGSTKIV